MDTGLPQENGQRFPNTQLRRSKRSSGNLTQRLPSASEPLTRSLLLVLLQPKPFHRGGLQLEAGKTLDLGAIAITP